MKKSAKITMFVLSLTLMNLFSSDKEIMHEICNHLPFKVITVLDSCNRISPDCFYVDKLTRTNKKNKTKKQKNDYKRQLEYQEKQKYRYWYQKKLPLIDSDTKCAYNLFGLVALTLLSGSAMMIQPVFKSCDLIQMKSDKKEYHSVFQTHLKPHQLPQEIGTESKKYKKRCLKFQVIDK